MSANRQTKIIEFNKLYLKKQKIKIREEKRIRKREEKEKNNKYKPKPTIYNNILFKSCLEASYAKLFDKYNINWKYEPETFYLENSDYIKGIYPTQYTPDFLLEDNYWFEVKGKIDKLLNGSLKAKELYFIYLEKDKLFIGTSFYPSKEPDFIFYITDENVELESNYDYTYFIIDDGSNIKITFKEFIDLVKKKENMKNGENG